MAQHQRNETSEPEPTTEARTTFSGSRYPQWTHTDSHDSHAGHPVLCINS